MKYNQLIATETQSLAATLEKKDWGFSFQTDCELAALRQAYIYRNNKHGVKIDKNEATGIFLITVFNEKAADFNISKF